MDYDFFTNHPITEDIIFSNLPWLRDIEKIRVRRDINTYVYETKADVKITFLGGLAFGRTSEPVFCNDNGIWLASPDDIFAEKVKTLFQRVALKDYLDLVALIKNGYSLERAVSAACTLYEGMPNINTILQTIAFHNLKELKNISKSDSRTLIHACKNFSLNNYNKIQIVSYDLAPSQITNKITIQGSLFTNP